MTLAIAEGLHFTVDGTFPQKVCDVAHRTDVHGLHHPGFCLVCADIYASVMKALPDHIGASSDPPISSSQGQL